MCVGLTAVRQGANVAITSGMIYEFEKDKDDFLDMTMEEASWLREKSFSNVQGSAKRWALGCVNSNPVARGSQEARFKQPRDNFLADPCIVLLIL